MSLTPFIIKDELDQLRDLYTDEQILKMWNSTTPNTNEFQEEQVSIYFGTTNKNMF